jgi:TatD DNase family protein
MLVDVHSHLTFPDFKKDIDEVIKRAEQANVKHIVTSGTDLKSNQEALDLSKKYKIVYASLGAYPTETKRKTIGRDLEFIKKNKKDIISVGECGLDYKEAKNKEEQKENFRKVIELAEKIKKPLIIHSRKAEADALEILNSYKLKNVVMHCFTPNFKLVNRAYEQGCFFSIPTIISRLQHFQKMVAEIPIEKILTETDAPFLSPFKETRNEPAFIVETIKKIAEIKKLEQSEVEKLIFMNFQRLFLKNF